MTADSIARTLNARRSGSYWMAKCPSHDDHNPSLSILDADGKVLLYCHVGCRPREVIGALKACGLWQPERAEKPRIVATYDYTDEYGKLLYQVVRYQPKDFKQRRPDGRGGWIWRKGPRQVLYHLPEVLEAPIVFVVEGEKDAETLRSQGFVATTNAGGADAPWLPEFTEALGHAVDSRLRCVAAMMHVDFFRPRPDSSFALGVHSKRACLIRLGNASRNGAA